MGPARAASTAAEETGGVDNGGVESGENLESFGMKQNDMRRATICRFKNISRGS
jgi:hypothetical protein